MVSASARRRGLDQFLALGDRHRAMAGVVGAAAAWAEAAATRTRRRADDVAWSRAAADLTGSQLAWWGFERPVPVVSVKYAHRLDELHADMGTAVMVPVVVMVGAGFSAATVQEVKATVKRAWSEDRSTRSYEGDVGEATHLHRDLHARRGEWAAEVADAPHFLAGAGVFSTWLARYFAATDDLVNQAAQVIRDAYSAAARATYEPMLVYERPGEAAARLRGIPTDERSLQRAAELHAATYIGGWMRTLSAGGVRAEEREATLRGLEPRYGAAVARYRRMMAENEEALARMQQRRMQEGG